VLGRPVAHHVTPDALAAVKGLSERQAARALGVPRSTYQRLVARNPRELAA
jgi:DNA-directed RNA polymerase specialized sigma24 family protein